MNKFNIQRFKQDLTLPINNDQEDASVLAKALNGLLRTIVVNAPAMSGSSFTLYILGNRGETLFSKASLTPNQLNVIRVDANNHPLMVPLALEPGVSPFRIKSVGTADGTVSLTFSNTGAIADGGTVTIGNKTYRLKTAIAQANDVLIEPDVAAVGTVTSDNTNPDAGGTIVVDDQTYTLVASFSAGPTVPNEVLIGVDADTTLGNLRKAINGTGTEGVEYSVGTLQPTTPVTAGAVTVGHTMPITADTPGTSGNSIVFTENATHISIDGAGVLGGTTPGSWSGDDTLQNLVDAINLEDGAGQSGTKYHADTTAHTQVSAGAVGSHATVISAVETIDDPSSIASTETASNLVFSAATLSGGGELAARTFNVDLYIERGS